MKNENILDGLQNRCIIGIYFILVLSGASKLRIQFYTLYRFGGINTHMMSTLVIVPSLLANFI